MKNKVVIITGGATGIGLALAKSFGRRGARIVIAGLDEGRLSAAINNLTGLKIPAVSFVCDVTDVAQVEALADFAWQAYGQVDVVINNAGVAQASRALIDTSPVDLQDVFNVNVFGVWHGCQVFGRRLIAQGTPAAIYNTGSENSLFVAVPRAAAYVASKHAVLGLTDALREEMPDYITVGLIVPGLVGSDLVPEPIRSMAMSPEDFAENAVNQIIAGDPYVVSHSYNQVRIDDRYEAISGAYAKSAPRHEGDDKYDVKTIIAKGRGRAER